MGVNAEAFENAFVPSFKEKSTGISKDLGLKQQNTGQRCGARGHCKKIWMLDL
jgi:hypothetical protein